MAPAKPSRQPPKRNSQLVQPAELFGRSKIGGLAGAAVVAAVAMRALLWAALGALLCEAVLDDTYYKTLGVPTDASTLQVRPSPALRHPTPSLRR